MLKKTITYHDLDGKEITEDFYFHLSKAEIAEMVLVFEGGDLVQHLREMVKTKNAPTIIKTFKGLIKSSYGKRSDDGRRFIKDEKATQEFTETEAYSIFFMELVTDAKKALEFVRGVLPSDMSEKIEVTDTAAEDWVEQTLAEIEGSDVDMRPAWEKENREPTKEELMSMPKEQLAALFANKAATKASK